MSTVGQTPFDWLGVWLAGRRLRRHISSFAGKRIGIFGCGFDAPLARTVLSEVAEAVLIDVALADDLRRHPRVVAIEAPLPDALATLRSASLDAAIIGAALHSVVDPQRVLSETRRLLAPGGLALISVTSWRGKRLLELAAFRLRLTSSAAVDERKFYYDVPDLWPMLVAAGFRPGQIQFVRTALGLTTLAVCGADP